MQAKGCVHYRRNGAMYCALKFKACKFFFYLFLIRTARYLNIMLGLAMKSDYKDRAKGDSDFSSLSLQ